MRCERHKRRYNWVGLERLTSTSWLLCEEGLFLFTYDHFVYFAMGCILSYLINGTSVPILSAADILLSWHTDLKWKWIVMFWLLWELRRHSFTEVPTNFMRKCSLIILSAGKWNENLFRFHVEWSLRKYFETLILGTWSIKFTLGVKRKPILNYLHCWNKLVLCEGTFQKFFEYFPQNSVLYQ